MRDLIKLRLKGDGILKIVREKNYNGPHFDLRFIESKAFGIGRSSASRLEPDLRDSDSNH